jgi:hypothetical protein
MKPTDRKAFLEVVVGFAELKGKQLSAPALELYWRAMQGWELAAFRAAAEQLIRTCEFMPTPKDFEDLRKAGELTAGEAWAMVLDHVRSGFYRDVPEIFADQPRIEAAVRAIGGFNAIAMSRTDQTPFLERRFAEHYEAISEREDIREAVPQIAGSPRARVLGPRRLAEIGFELDT